MNNDKQDNPKSCPACHKLSWYLFALELLPLCSINSGLLQDSDKERLSYITLMGIWYMNSDILFHEKLMISARIGTFKA